MLEQIESSILDRLGQKLTGWRIISAADARAAEAQPTGSAPLLLLAFGGIDVKESVGNGITQRITVGMTAIVVARHAQDAARGSAAKRAVLSLVDEVFAALAGFTPTGATSTLRLNGAGAMEFAPPVCYLPLDFACDTILKAQT